MIDLAEILAQPVARFGATVVTLGQLRKRRGKEAQVVTTGSLKVQ